MYVSSMILQYFYYQYDYYTDVPLVLEDSGTCAAIMAYEPEAGDLSANEKTLEDFMSSFSSKGGRRSEFVVWEVSGKFRHSVWEKA